MSFSGDAVFTNTDGVAWREVTEELVVINLKSGEYITFNDTGKSIWLSVTGGKSVKETAESLIDEYDVDRETALSDTIKFITNFVNEGLLVENDRTIEKGEGNGKGEEG